MAVRDGQCPDRLGSAVALSSRPVSGRSEDEPVGVGVEPAAAGLVAGEAGLERGPEVVRVVGDGEVDEFVHDDGVEDIRRGHDQAPVKGERASAGTATPAGVLIAHGEAADGWVVGSAQRGEAVEQDLSGLAPVPAFERGWEV